jgi:hypothetical protein
MYQNGISIDGDSGSRARRVFLLKLKEKLDSEINLLDKPITDIFIRNMYNLLNEYNNQKMNNRVFSTEGKLIFEKLVLDKKLYHEIAEKYSNIDLFSVLKNVPVKDLYSIFEGAFIDSDYFLSDIEIELGAYLFDKKVQLFTWQKGKYHEYPMTFNVHSSGEIIMIAHKNTHYERCKILSGGVM